MHVLMDHIDEDELICLVKNKKNDSINEPQLNGDFLMGQSTQWLVLQKHENLRVSLY